jgi:hypothetical protein
VAMASATFPVPLPQALIVGAVPFTAPFVPNLFPPKTLGEQSIPAASEGRRKRREVGEEGERAKIYWPVRGRL